MMPLADLLHRPRGRGDQAPLLLLLPSKLGVPMLDGPIVTAGGIIFITGTRMTTSGPSVCDGRQLWQDRLPAGGQSDADDL